MLTGPLCAAARALVEISQTRLSEKVSIPEATLVAFENGSANPNEAVLLLLRSKLEELEAEFLPDDKTMG